MPPVGHIDTNVVLWQSALVHGEVVSETNRSWNPWRAGKFGPVSDVDHDWSAALGFVL